MVNGCQGRIIYIHGEYWVSSLLALGSDIMVQHILSGDSVGAPLVSSPCPWVWSLSHRLLSKCLHHVSTPLWGHRGVFPLAPCPHSPQLLRPLISHIPSPPPPKSLLLLCTASGMGCWQFSVAFSSAAGWRRRGRRVCFESCISQDAFGGRKISLTQAGLNNRELSHISRMPGGRVGPKLVELAFQQWHPGRVSLCSLLCHHQLDSFSSWWQDGDNSSKHPLEMGQDLGEEKFSLSLFFFVPWLFPWSKERHCPQKPPSHHSLQRTSHVSLERIGSIPEPVTSKENRITFRSLSPFLELGVRSMPP